jgi:hypothetical protein
MRLRRIVLPSASHRRPQVKLEIVKPFFTSMQGYNDSMIDISKKELITLDEAAQLLPAGRRGRRVNLSTIFRWVVEGSNGIRLEAVRIGARWLTTTACLQRFAEQLTEAALSEQSATPSTPGEQPEAIARDFQKR